MALVFTEGFEVYGAYESDDGPDAGDVSLFGATLSGSIALFKRSSYKHGINGYCYVRLNSTSSLTTPLNGSYSSGVLSFLLNPSWNNPTTGRTLVSVRGSGSDLVSIRFISGSTTFPNAGYTMELFAGGVQVGTFLINIAMLGAWSRWTLTWDTSGPNIEAAFYQEGALLVSGTGGSTGAGTPVDAFALYGASNTYAYWDSVTVWDDPAADLAKANSPHWVGVMGYSPHQSGTSLGDYQNFFGANSPYIQWTFGEGLATTQPNGGILTAVSSGTVDVPICMMREVDDATAILAVSPKSRVVGVGLTTCDQAVVVSSTASASTSTDVSSSTTATTPVETDPSTGLPWALPTKVTILDPDGDGGFEGGTAFGDSNWQESSGGSPIQWYCGTLGAIDGSYGAYLSSDGGATNTPSVTSAGFSYSYLWYDFTVPAGVTQIVVSAKAQLTLNNGLIFGVFGTSTTPVGGNTTVYSAMLDYPQEFQAPYVGSSTNQNLWEIQPASQYKSDIVFYPRDVLPGTTYRLVICFVGNTTTTESVGAKLDSVAIYGYSGSIADVSVRYTAS